MITRTRVTSPAFPSSRCSASALISSLILLAAAAGCTPEFEDRSSAIGPLRLLAVQSTPAEAAPNAAVHYKALLVDGHGERTESPIDWAYCSQQKPQGDLNDVATACFVLTADYLTSLGTGIGAKGLMPANACRQFGPDVPEAKPGDPPGRPSDPDTTGGYYQPVRLILPDGDRYLLSSGETRITCGLPGATSETLLAFKRGNHPNENPAIEALFAGDRMLMPDDGMAPPLEVGKKQPVKLRVSWPACPEAPVCGDGICSPGEAAVDCPDDCNPLHAKGCSGAEGFAYFDLGTQEITNRREAMIASWFATSGSFESDRTGQDEASTRRDTENTWTAPDEAADVVIWVVLRDSRGGVTWQRYRVRVG